MPQFMIEFPHTDNQCEKLLSDTEQSGRIPDIYYGCAAGRHTAWAVVRAADENEARCLVPATLRQDVKITPVEGTPKSDMMAA